MSKKALIPIGILIVCGTAYTAGSAENPSTTAAPATSTTAPAVPAVTSPAAPTVPAAASTAVAPAAVPAAAPAAPAAASTVAAPAAAAAAASTAAPAVPAAASTAAPAAALNLSGKWSSNLVGDVTIEQKDNKITGTYQYTEDNVTYDGKIEGLIKDKLIQAKWWARPKVGSGEESRGDLEWKITDDGKMLVGWYREEGEKEKDDFNLQR
ncbi:MAG: hypothetical protein U1F70_15535 [Candidatus Competibacteraceae bacterium]